MISTEEKQDLQQQLQYILPQKDRKIHNHYTCPLCGSGNGKHKTGALSYFVDRSGVPRVTCFSCNRLQNADIFDYIGAIHGETSFIEQYKLVKKELGISDDYDKQQYYKKTEQKTKVVNNSLPLKEKNFEKAKEVIQQYKEDTVKINYMQYYKACQKDITPAIKYFASRGITNIDLLKKYMIGFDYKHQTIVFPKTKYDYMFRYINPTGNQSNKNCWNKGSSSKQLYNIHYIKEACQIKDKEKLENNFFNDIFIVEDIYSLLTIEQAGFKAISLNSTNNIDVLLNELEKNKDEDVFPVIIPLLDKDNAGVIATEKLYNKIVSICEYREKNSLPNFLPLKKEWYNMPHHFSFKFNPIILKNTAIKDINDVLKLYGKDLTEKIIKAIQTLPLYQVSYQYYALLQLHEDENYINDLKKDMNSQKEHLDEEIFEKILTSKYIDKLPNREKVIDLPIKEEITEVNTKKEVDTTVIHNDTNTIQEEKQTNIINLPLKEKYIKFTINRYLAEKENQILELINSAKKSLLIAPTGAGKTELIQKIKVPEGQVLIIVNPSVAQLKQMQSNYKYPAICDGADYLGEDLVCVTPESLHKVIKGLNNRKYTMIIDEAHTLFTKGKFRKSFYYVSQIVEKAETVIYMTATPEVLIKASKEINFDTIIEVNKDKQTSIKVSLFECEKLNIGVITNVVEKALKQTQFVALHHDNIKENNIICNKLNESYKIKVYKDNFQLDVFDSKDYNYYEKTINTAEKINASVRNGAVFDNLLKNNTIPEDVRFFCTTSCIQAGININKPETTTVIYVINENDFYLDDFIQSVGRYRLQENIKEVIILKKKLDEDKKLYASFNTIYQSLKDKKDIIIKLANGYKFDNLDSPEGDLSKLYNLIFNEKDNTYEILEHTLIEITYRQYNQGILYNTNILKQKLEKITAIKFNVTIFNEFINENKEVKEMLKEDKKIRKEIFTETISEMLTLEDEKLKDILTNNIDMRKEENKELIELQRDYQETASTTFKNVIKMVMTIKEVDKETAFKEVASSETLQDVNKELKQIIICRLNKDINTMYKNGKELKYKDYKVHSKLVKQVIFIRNKLRNIELKRSSISIETVDKLLDEMIKKKLFHNIDERKKLLSLLNLIYNLGDKKQISSAKTKF